MTIRPQPADERGDPHASRVAGMLLWLGVTAALVVLLIALLLSLEVTQAALAVLAAVLVLLHLAGLRVRSRFQALAVAFGAGTVMAAAATVDVRSLSEAPPGQVLSGQVRVVDVPHARKITAVAASRHGRYLGAAIGERVVVWDRSGSEQFSAVFDLDRGETVTAVAISADGARVAVASPRRVYLYQTRDQLRPARHVAASGVDAVTFSEDGTVLAYADDLGVKVWTLTDQERASFPLPASGVQSVGISPNGQLFALGRGDRIEVWGVPAHAPHGAPSYPRLRFSVYSKRGMVRALGFRADGDRLLAVTDTDVLDYDLSRRLLRAARAQHLEPETRVSAVSVSGDTVATVTGSGIVTRAVGG